MATYQSEKRVHSAVETLERRTRLAQGFPQGLSSGATFETSRKLTMEMILEIAKTDSTSEDWAMTIVLVEDSAWRAWAEGVHGST